MGIGVGTLPFGMWADVNNNGAGDVGGYIVEYSTVPEPATVAMLGVGIAFLRLRRKSCI